VVRVEKAVGGPVAVVETRDHAGDVGFVEIGSKPDLVFLHEVLGFGGILISILLGSKRGAQGAHIVDASKGLAVLVVTGPALETGVKRGRLALTPSEEGKVKRNVESLGVCRRRLTRNVSEDSATR
jgi:hypothetical protein